MKITAKKLKMTQVWKNDVVIPVTVLKLTKWNEVDPEKAEKPLENSGKTKVKAPEKTESENGGSENILAGIKEGDIIKISGKSKGKGFQGVVKRWGFHGAPKSHGTKHHLRAPGSIGATGPQRVIPGKKMAGRMGNQRTTLKTTVQEINPKENTIMIKGAVPGMRGTTVEIKPI